MGRFVWWIVVVVLFVLVIPVQVAGMITGDDWAVIKDDEEYI